MPGNLFPDDGWGGESGPPGADGPGPAGQGAAGQGAAPVPECFDAGFFPRGTAATPGEGPGPRRPGRFGPGAGFAAGDVLDTAMPGPALAGFTDAAAGTGRAYTGLNDDELIGTLVAWQKTEAWTAAGRLSAVAELIRRRPGADNAPPPASAGTGATGGNGVSTAAGAAIPRTDKRGQMPRKPRDLIPVPARIIGPRVISHDRSLSPRSRPARSPSPYASAPPWTSPASVARQPRSCTHWHGSTR